MKADCHVFGISNGSRLHNEFKPMLNFKHLSKPLSKWTGAYYEPITSPL